MKQQRYLPFPDGDGNLNRRLLAILCTAILALLTIDSCGNPAVGQQHIGQQRPEQPLAALQYAGDVDNRSAAKQNSDNRDAWTGNRPGNGFQTVKNFPAESIPTTIVEFWRYPQHPDVEIVRGISSGSAYCRVKLEDSVIPHGERASQRTWELPPAAIQALLRQLAPLRTVAVDPWDQRTTAILFSIPVSSGATQDLLHKLSDSTPAWARETTQQLQTCLHLLHQLPPAILPIRTRVQVQDQVI